MLSLGLNSPNTSNATHFTSTNQTLLDLFFVSNLSKVLLYDQLSASCFSRHDLIFMTYNYHLNLPEQIIVYRDFKNIDYTMLEEEFFNIDWSELYYLISVDDQLSFLQSNIEYLYNRLVPLRSKVINQGSKPWFTQSVKRAIDRRDYLYVRWKRFRIVEFYEEYRVSRRTTNKLIKKAKSNYYASKFSTAIGSKKICEQFVKLALENLALMNSLLLTLTF